MKKNRNELVAIEIIPDLLYKSKVIKSDSYKFIWNKK